VEVGQPDTGKELALLFDEGDYLKPLIVGIVLSPTKLSGKLQTRSTDTSPEKVVVEIDGRSVELSATETITLRCGAASISLTRDGKVLIRGTYLQSRSDGTNRIQGGAVRIN